MVSVHVEAVPHLHRTLAFIRIARRAGRRRAQPVHARVGARGDRRRPRLRGRDVGEPRLRRAEVHSAEPRQDPPRAGRARAPRARRRRSRSTAASTPANIEAIAAAGASIFVAGHAIFGTPDPEAATRALRARAEQARPRRARERPDSRRRPHGARPRALRRHRPDGRHLPRQLPRVVRGGPHRLAARRRAGPTATWRAPACRCP